MKMRTTLTQLGSNHPLCVIVGGVFVAFNVEPQDVHFSGSVPPAK